MVGENLLDPNCMDQQNFETRTNRDGSVAISYNHKKSLLQIVVAGVITRWAETLFQGKSIQRLDAS